MTTVRELMKPSVHRDLFDVINAVYIFDKHDGKEKSMLEQTMKKLERRIGSANLSCGRPFSSSSSSSSSSSQQERERHQCKTRNIMGSGRAESVAEYRTRICLTKGLLAQERQHNRRPVYYLLNFFLLVLVGFALVATVSTLALTTLFMPLLGWMAGIGLLGAAYFGLCGYGCLFLWLEHRRYFSCLASVSRVLDSVERKTD